MIIESNTDLVRLERKARPLDGLRFRRRSSVETLATAQAQLPKRRGAGEAAARFNIQLRRGSTHSAESDKDGAHPVKEAVERRESIPPGWLHGGSRRNSKQNESGICTVHASEAILGRSTDDVVSEGLSLLHPLRLNNLALIHPDDCVEREHSKLQRPEAIATADAHHSRVPCRRILCSASTDCPEAPPAIPYLPSWYRHQQRSALFEHLRLHFDLL